MGLFDFIKRLFFGSPAPNHRDVVDAPRNPHSSEEVSTSAGTTQPEQTPPSSTEPEKRQQQPKSEEPKKHIYLTPLHYESSLVPTPVHQEIVHGKPYRFANSTFISGEYYDLSQDADERWLEYYGLPSLKTPDDLADWLHLPIGKLAWLAGRNNRDARPEAEQFSHYHYEWVRKRSGGVRLIEAPKQELKRVQSQILRKILDQVPSHPKAHGFVPGRSIISNARPHIGKRFILKFDLENFYPSVTFNRVVAIYRSLGFSREVSIWLGRLTTSNCPWGMSAPERDWRLSVYWRPHLPQGSPSSPAIANLSAFSLDVRLAGMAEKYCLTYTRYADDLTFSGGGKSIPALREIIQLVTKIIRSERFRVNRVKRKVLRNNQRQTVTGVVVNQRPNVARPDFDRLKAILHNCIKHGPASQNRYDHENFSEHLRGRIAHVMQLNPKRGAKLLAMFQQIHW